MKGELIKDYELKKLPYSFDSLKPFLSEEQLRLHYEKHHAGYVKNTNTIINRLVKIRAEGSMMNLKAELKDLSFNLSGHILHSLFWGNLSPKDNVNPISAELQNAIELNFGSIDEFKKEFSNTAISVEGSGWAVLMMEKETGRLLIAQLEKHNQNIYSGLSILLVLDVWEHAYYLDYKNDRAKYVETFWDFVNWGEVNDRFKKK